MEKRLREVLVRALCPNARMAEQIRQEAEEEDLQLGQVVFRVFAAYEALFRGSSETPESQRDELSALAVLEAQKRDSARRKKTGEVGQLIELKCLIEQSGDFCLQDMSAAVRAANDCKMVAGSFPRRVQQMRGLVEELVGD